MLVGYFASVSTWFWSFLSTKTTAATTTASTTTTTKKEKKRGRGGDAGGGGRRKSPFALSLSFYNFHTLNMLEEDKNALVNRNSKNAWNMCQFAQLALLHSLWLTTPTRFLFLFFCSRYNRLYEMSKADRSKRLWGRTSKKNPCTFVIMGENSGHLGLQHRSRGGHLWWLEITRAAFGTLLLPWSLWPLF